MANFERNLDLNDVRNYSYLFLFYKSLTNFLPFTPCALTPHRLLSEKGRLSYAILLHSFLSIFYMCLHVLSCPQNCYNLWRSYFNRNTTLIGTFTALSPFDFNSASFFTLRLSKYFSNRDRAEGGTRRRALALPPPPNFKKHLSCKACPYPPPWLEPICLSIAPSPLAQEFSAQALSSKPSFACIK